MLYTASISKIKMFWCRDEGTNKSPGVLLIHLIIVITFLQEHPIAGKPLSQAPLRDAVIFS